ncbi:MAG: 30S ribosomal protein S3 [Patescibacteria group bacterium]
MGQKVHPKIFRTGVIYSWPSKWFSVGRDFPSKIKQDVEIRRFLMHKLREAGVDRVEIERDAQKITITVHTAKPGLVIGRGGAGAEDLKKEIKRRFLPKVKLGEINLNINEVDRPNLSASIVAQSMVLDIEKRLPYKRVMKQAIMHVQRAGALGVKVLVKGRLNGAEIAREEKMVAGKIPLHTLRADIDYARGEAHTTYGSIGVKVWIYRGEIFSKEESKTGEVIGEVRSKK